MMYRGYSSRKNENRVEAGFRGFTDRMAKKGIGGPMKPFSASLFVLASTMRIRSRFAVDAWRPMRNSSASSARTYLSPSSRMAFIAAFAMNGAGSASTRLNTPVSGTHSATYLSSVCQCVR